MERPVYAPPPRAAPASALDEILDRVVAVARPVAVLLFGSHAENRPQAHSDLDLLVIADTDDTGKLTEDLCEAVAQVRRGRWDEIPPCDLLVLTPQEWLHESRLPGLVAANARKRGVTIYGRAA